MKNKLAKALACLLAIASIWGFSIMLAPSPSAYAQSSSGFTPAIGTIRIGSEVFPIVPHHPTKLHLPSSRHHLSKHPSPATNPCQYGGYWIAMGDVYDSGGGYHAEADVYGLYDSPFQNADYCNEIYCYGAAFGDPHTAPLSPINLLCYASGNSDSHECNLPSGGQNGSVCGMESSTFYNTPWGQAITVAQWKVTANTGEQWG